MKQFSLVALGICLAGTLAPTVSDAQVIYSNPPYLAQWDNQSSRVRCELSQPIDGYGRAVFSQEAGRQAKFELDAFRPIHQNGEALLVARPGSWRPGDSGRDLLAVKTRTARPALQIRGDQVQTTVNTLLDGWQVVLAEGDNEVRLQPARFPPAYRDWVDCLGNLLPQNFSDVERNVLYFEKGQSRLTEVDRGILAGIAEYVQLDRAVSGVFIDGHTDDGGGFLENEDVSRLRAEQVARFLESEGIDPSRVMVRFHGEYYPVASNATPEGRAANRRVTIRLERNGIPPRQRETVVAYDRQVENAPPRLPPGLDD